MLYPDIEPFAQGMLDVGHGHQIYWEQCGAPEGQAVVFLHGGPGGACSPTSRRYFDPQRYRAVLFDQRGCGRSQAAVRTHHNTLADLVGDLERLRQYLAIERWMVCGVSWGCTLALAYTSIFRHRVQAMVLRGVFAGRQAERDWLYKPGGASQLFPQAWHAFATALGPVEPQQLLQAYAQRLRSGDERAVQAAARAWCAWEEAIGCVQSDAGMAASLPEQDLAMAQIATHIFLNDPDLGKGLLAWPDASWQSIPAILVNGQWDAITPLTTAWHIHQDWPGSELRVVAQAGHMSSDEPLRRAFITALDDIADQLVCRSHPQQPVTTT